MLLVFFIRHVVDSGFDPPVEVEVVLAQILNGAGLHAEIVIGIIGEDIEIEGESVVDVGLGFKEKAEADLVDFELGCYFFELVS